MPTPANEDITRVVTHEANVVFDHCLEVISHCLGQLSDDQIWWRPHESLNSVGNLVLHLTGNVRQWIVAGLGNQDDTRDRPSEFAQRTAIDREALLNGLREVVAEAKSVLAEISAEKMLSPHRIQGFEVTGWGALFDSLPHFKGHTQEIVCLTRMQLGNKYEFHWKPTSPEQGAP